ncbi:MAG: TolC family protein [Lentisphaeraceae bacterium]|nr:TolC family protein [Lentisphaeraceae bacterium]
MIRNILVVVSVLSVSLLAQDKMEEKKLTVEECFTYALENSPEIKKRLFNLSNSEYDTQIQRAVFDLSLSGGAARNLEYKENSSDLTLSQELPGGVDISASGSLDSDDQENSQDSSLSLAISKKLLGGGSLEESLQGYRDSLVQELINRNRLSREKRNIRSEIQSLFYQIIQNKQSLEVEKRRLESAKKNLEHAIERDKPLDIATAKIEIPETELNLIRAERQIQANYDELKVLIGMSPDKTIGINEEFNFELLKTEIYKDLEYAEGNDELFINNALSKEILDRDLRVKKEKTQIDLSLSFQQNFRNSDSDNANLGGNDDQVVSLNFGWDFGRRSDKARLAQSKNNLDENTVDRYILRQNKFRQLRGFVRDIDETAKSIVIQEQRIALNQTQIELYKDRWENGEIDILEYIRSQNNLESSRVQLIRLKTNYMDLVNRYLFEVGK